MTVQQLCSPIYKTFDHKVNTKVRNKDCSTLAVSEIIAELLQMLMTSYWHKERTTFLNAVTNQEIIQDVFGVTTTDHTTDLSMLYPYQCENPFRIQKIFTQSQSQSSITMFRKIMMGMKLSADKLEEMTNQEDPNTIIIWTSNWGFANVSSLKFPDTVNLHKRQTKHHKLLTKQTEEVENEISVLKSHQAQHSRTCL